MSETCAVHHGVPAAFECESCGAKLCGDCAVEGKYLTTCGLCGEVAHPLPGMASPVQAPWRGNDGSDVAANELVSVRLTNHVVVPGAIIAMVTALLFFLIDVRSVFLPLGLALKWLGFWFVFATVLIARYGKTSSHRERQGCYTAALGAAMALVLVAQPWNTKGTDEPLGILVNGAIVAVVWRYATRLAASLSREGESLPAKEGLEVYGVERLSLEAWEREQDDPRLRLKLTKKRSEEKKEDEHGNPSAAVARLVAAALVVFAAGEPLILAGEPEIGVNALAAMIVFLFASGLVLAAGSAVGTLRHARRREARVSEGLVPARVATAGFLMVALLTIALATPGVVYRGTGELRQRTGPATGESANSGDSTQSEAQEAQGETRPAESEAQEGGGGPTLPPVDVSATLAPAATMLDFLAVIGKFLVLPFVIAVVLGGFYVLSRLAPFLAKMKLSGWRGWLARLAAIFARRPKGEKRSTKKLSADLNLDGLQSLPPRESVVTGYTRLVGSLAALGYPVERRTPYELFAALPAHLGRIRKPFDRLTSLYVGAAYGAAEPGDEDRREVLSLLAEIKRLLPK